MDLHELSPVGRWATGGRDGRWFERFAEMCEDLPDRPRAHICLQPLALAGFAFVAGWWPTVALPFRWLFGVGAMLDLLVGILLHYAVQGFLIDRWLTPDRPLTEVVGVYNLVAQVNYEVKTGVGWRFVGDTFAETPAIPVIIAAASLGLAVWQVRRGPRRD